MLSARATCRNILNAGASDSEYMTAFQQRCKCSDDYIILQISLQHLVFFGEKMGILLKI